MSCQPHRVTSGQSNSGHKQIHISKPFSQYMYINHLSRQSTKPITSASIKHHTQTSDTNFWRASPFDITAVKRAHKAMTCWYCRPFRLIYLNFCSGSLCCLKSSPHQKVTGTMPVQFLGADEVAANAVPPDIYIYIHTDRQSLCSVSFPSWLISTESEKTAKRLKMWSLHTSFALYFERLIKHLTISALFGRLMKHLANGYTSFLT